MTVTTNKKTVLNTAVATARAGAQGKSSQASVGEIEIIVNEI